MAANKGIIIASLIAIIGAALLGIALAVMQMDSVDGQAITSVRLAILSGATVGTLGGAAGAAGAIIGTALRRAFLAVSS